MLMRPPGCVRVPLKTSSRSSPWTKLAVKELNYTRPPERVGVSVYEASLFVALHLGWLHVVDDLLQICQRLFAVVLLLVSLRANRNCLVVGADDAEAILFLLVLVDFDRALHGLFLLALLGLGIHGRIDGQDQAGDGEH